MRVVIQRVRSSQVAVNGQIAGIGRGLNLSGLRVETGQFGAMMQVSIENDGPVTLLLERNAS